ncbi:MAG TPA: hemolysin family protein [Thermoanaerobaculia bacterium]|nr:hemolysin family protein [Thermoanaerobaculia bacterium]
MTETSNLPWEWLTVVFLVAAALLLTLSALLERSGPIRLRHWAEEAGGRLLAVYESRQRFETFRFLLGLLARLGLVGLFVATLNSLLVLGLVAAELFALGLVALVAAGSEILNRTLVFHDPERGLRKLTAVYRALLLLLAPLVLLIAPLVPETWLERREDAGHGEAATDEEIEAFIDVGTREGILEPEERDLVWGIVDFGESVVRSVMTPRVDVAAAPVDSSLETLADRFIETGYSRLPLYDTDPDAITGVLHIRDLLAGLRAEPRPAAGDLARPPYLVAETKPLNELLREFQARGLELAIVVDEHGGTAGLVTMEDLLERIVGEIADEADEPPRHNEQLGGGAWRLAGTARLSELEEIFGIEVGEAPFETVSGLVTTTLGSIPRGGEVVDALGLRFTVEAADGRRVLRVRAEPHDRRRPGGREPETMADEEEEASRA